MADPRRPPAWQLFLECLQRELTYLPMAASFLLAWFVPDWGPTWVIAPSLFTAGGAHFFYDFLLGQEVRRQLEARAEKKELRERVEADAKICAGLELRDREALTAVRALEKALVDKIGENKAVLELSGTFAHTYEEMARQLADSAVASLRKKAALLATARQLKALKAEREARELEEKLPRLDRRVEEVRVSLKESLTQVALMEDEKNEIELNNLSSAFGSQLKLAGEIAREVSDSGSFARPLPEGVKPAVETASKKIEEAQPDVLVLEETSEEPDRAPGQKRKTR